MTRAFGCVQPGFEPVQDAFSDALPEVGKGGAAFAAVFEGQIVVDLWAGQAHGKPWTESTRAVLMSATKGISTIVVAALADRGDLDIDAPVARYWPEFAAGGKSGITVAQILTHTSGLVTIPRYKEFIGRGGEGWERTEEILDRLESATPEWSPGSALGYHGLTFGWLVGELARRVSGVTIGTLLGELIVAPLGLELDLGTPVEDQEIVAPVITPESPLTTAAEATRLADPASLFSRMILAVDGHSVLDEPDTVFGDPGRLALELPASNATGTARALAVLYGELADPGAAHRVPLSHEVVRRFAGERARGPSILTGAEERWALGFARPVTSTGGSAQVWGPEDQAFGHPGLGGQIGFADPVSRVGIGMVRNHLSATSALGQRLVDAFYSCL